MRQVDWHRQAAEEVLAQLGSDAGQGLSEKEAARRLEEYGPNRLAEYRGKPFWRLFLDQFGDFMVLVLLGATAISLFLGEVADALTIMAIVLANAVLGCLQEYRAEQSLEALRKLTAPEATVRRAGQEKRVPAELLVPGDILLLEAGDRVAADARLLAAHSLEVEEAALTGESHPVRKDPRAVLPAEAPLGDRATMVYLGTVVTRGRAEAVVVGTGMASEMGRIAGLIQEVREEETPLQRRLDGLGRWLVAFCLGICAVVVATGVWRGEPLYRMFLAGVSLAVAAIPEGLPAIVTVALAIGVQKMIRRQAVVRRLPAVETLGCATVICSDKTGTLTKNEMTVRRLWAGGRLLDVEGEGYRPEGALTWRGQPYQVGQDEGLRLLLRAACLCNNARLRREGGGFWRRGKMDNWQVSGDPTEGALVVLSAKGGFWRSTVEEEEPRVLEAPFTSERKRMAVICRRPGGGFRAYVKGAPDVLLGLSAQVWLDGRPLPLTPALRENILAHNETMAGQALRVLALAYRDLAVLPEQPEQAEGELVFLGLAGMLDPPRPEAVRAVAACRQAGIRPVMITGDHPATARAVARELGLPAGRGEVLHGAELDAMDDGELRRRCEQVSVYARVSPQHKLRIVRALKACGHVVAMTGDGVNDAPAVKEADIGIAMGRSGTDVTREASAMVLADDNFATIVAAVEEGRAIYDNIRKFIRYLLSCNVGEVLVMFLAALAGLPLPLLPIQILWMNLVTDGLPAMALGVDGADPDIMRRPPREPRESVFAHGLLRRITAQGLYIGLGTLAVFVAALYLGEGDVPTAQTMAFATLVFAQLVHVFECRSERHSVFEIGFLGNPVLAGAVVISVLMELAVIYVPSLQAVFHTVPLNSFQWVMVLAVAAGRTALNGVGYLLSLPVRRRTVYLRV